VKNHLMKRRNLTLVLTLGLILVASASFACGGYGGYGMNWSNDQASLTPDQQKQLDTVKEKYAPQLKDLRAKLDSKRAEYRAARSNDETTVATLNKLDKEINELGRQYRTLLDQADSEVQKFAGDEVGPGFYCPNYDDDYRGGMMSYGRHMGPGYRSGMGYGMGGRYSGCNW